MRILLIENNVDVRLTLTEWLNDDGHEVTEADSFASARAMLQQGYRCEAVITEVLPQETEQEFAELVRQAGVPVLLCTGGANTLNGLHSQGFQCLLKPFKLEALTTWLADICLGNDRLARCLSC